MAPPSDRPPAAGIHGFIRAQQFLIVDPAHPTAVRIRRQRNRRPLVGERRGEYSPFTTAREICAAKLLRALPPPPTGPMQRGLELEPHARRLFLHQTGARALADLRQAVVTHRSRRYPWLLATPDDLITLRTI